MLTLEQYNELFKLGKNDVELAEIISERAVDYAIAIGIENGENDYFEEAINAFEDGVCSNSGRDELLKACENALIDPDDDHAREMIENAINKAKGVL